jgi:hypothetical protein
MFLPLVAIAFTFLGIWVFAVAIESWIRLIGNPKTAIASPESDISLVSLLLFLFAPAGFTNFLYPQKLETKSDRGED